MIIKSLLKWPTMLTVFILLGMTLSVFPVTATIFSDDGSNRTPAELYNLTNSSKEIDNNETAVFFFDPDCGACGPAHEYMESYLTNHTDANIEVENLSSGQQAKDRLDEFYIRFNREWENIPVVFIGPVGLEGTQEIISNFEGVYNWYMKKGVQLNS